MKSVKIKCNLRKKSFILKKQTNKGNDMWVDAESEFGQTQLFEIILYTSRWLVFLLPNFLIFFILKKIIY